MLKINSKLISCLMALVGLFLLFLPLVTLAQNPPPAAIDNAIEGLDQTAEQSQINTSVTANQIIGYVINLLLGFLGVLFLILIIYAGFQWMTAAGNEEKVKKSRELITQAGIGLMIILLAFVLTNFVIFKLLGITASASN